jgi:TIR domain
VLEGAVDLIFVNYRTGDEHGTAALIERELSRRFGSGRVFRDAKSIPAGERWEDTILGAVRNSAALVAVIGPRWLTTADDDGERAIDNPADWTRREIVEALSCGIRVIPVLIGSTPALVPAHLPTALAPLAGRQYLRFDHGDIDADIQRLTEALVSCLPRFRTSRTGRFRRLGRSALVTPTRQ